MPSQPPRASVDLCPHYVWSFALQLIFWMSLIWTLITQIWPQWKRVFHTHSSLVFIHYFLRCMALRAEPQDTEGYPQALNLNRVCPVDLFKRVGTPFPLLAYFFCCASNSYPKSAPLLCSGSRYLISWVSQAHGWQKVWPRWTIPRVSPTPDLDDSENKFRTFERIKLRCDFRFE